MSDVPREPYDGKSDQPGYGRPEPAGAGESPTSFLGVSSEEETGLTASRTNAVDHTPQTYQPIDDPPVTEDPTAMTVSVMTPDEHAARAEELLIEAEELHLMLQAAWEAADGRGEDVAVDPSSVATLQALTGLAQIHATLSLRLGQPLGTRGFQVTNPEETVVTGAKSSAPEHHHSEQGQSVPEQGSEEDLPPRRTQLRSGSKRSLQPRADQ
ncbi:hypothetical protein AB0M20_09310 [Actinoplanes sp. NPDC051633]|uniref:hypothetical protein n=1 Tax=Actinoplanes sp. NPDC051633 TaxID=3155670 RepID=UPI0034357523